MKRIISIVLSIGILGCTNPNNTTSQLPGRWINPDGAVLTLNPDSTFHIINLPAKVVNSAYNANKFDLSKQDKLTYKGYWTVDKYLSTDSFEINSVEDKAGKEIYPSLEFMIFRSGLLQTGPPNRIQIFLDSDGVDYYEFKRIHGN